jgi:hypothetical protein
MLAASKSVYEHVVYDSIGVERTFAEESEKNEAVRVYAKLPGWFTVPTPLGPYNPDWAVLIEKDGTERGCILSLKPRAASSPRTCDIKRARRSNAGKRISRPWQSARTRRNSYRQGISTMCLPNAESRQTGS